MKTLHFLNGLNKINRIVPQLGKYSRRGWNIMSLFAVSDSFLVLLVLIISPSTSPHPQNKNVPVAILLPNGNIVRDTDRPEFDREQVVSQPVLKPSKGSINSLLTPNFSNQRKKGLVGVQSAGTTNGAWPIKRIQAEGVWKDSWLPKSQKESCNLETCSKMCFTRDYPSRPNLSGGCISYLNSHFRNHSGVCPKIPLHCSKICYTRGWSKKPSNPFWDESSSQKFQPQSCPEIPLCPEYYYSDWPNKPSNLLRSCSCPQKLQPQSRPEIPPCPEYYYSDWPNKPRYLLPICSCPQKSQPQSHPEIQTSQYSTKFRSRDWPSRSIVLPHSPPHEIPQEDQKEVQEDDSPSSHHHYACVLPVQELQHQKRDCQRKFRESHEETRDGLSNTGYVKARREISPQRNGLIQTVCCENGSPSTHQPACRLTFPEWSPMAAGLIRCHECLPFSMPWTPAQPMLPLWLPHEQLWSPPSFTVSPFITALDNWLPLWPIAPFVTGTSAGTNVEYFLVLPNVFLSTSVLDCYPLVQIVVPQEYASLL